MLMEWKNEMGTAHNVKETTDLHATSIKIPTASFDIFRINKSKICMELHNTPQEPNNLD